MQHWIVGEDDRFRSGDGDSHLSTARLHAVVEEGVRDRIMAEGFSWLGHTVLTIVYSGTSL